MSTAILPERSLTSELVAVTEAAAIAAAHWLGHGDTVRADQAAVEAMRRAMDDVSFKGRVVIGEGERDAAPMLYIGEEVGGGDDLMVDIAVDPLEGTNLVARGQANATAVLAAAEPGSLLHAPDTYMEKLIVGPPAKGRVDLDRPVAENLRIIATSLNRDVEDLVVVVLERKRHEKLIAEIRSAGARIKLIPDGDLTAAISVVVAGTGVHAVMGTGGAPEGVLAAAALRCVGGEILARLRFRSDEERARAKRMGITDETRVYRTEDLVRAKRLAFIATGVTDGELLRGVRLFRGAARTHSLVMQLSQGKIRFVDTFHIEDPQHPPVIRLER